MERQSRTIRVIVAALLSLNVSLSVSADTPAEQDMQEAKKLYGFGVQHRNAGNDDEARRQFEQSIAVYDSLYQVYYSYGDLLVKMGDTKTAVQAFRKALDLNPDYYNAAAQLSKLYYETGDYASTLEMYQRMFVLKPDNPTILASIANIREYLGDSDGAYEDLGKLVAMGDDSYENLMRMSRLALEKEDPESSHMYAVLALGKRPDDLPALALAAKTGMLLNDTEKAVRFYRRLAEVDSASVETIVIVEGLYRSAADRANLIWALKRHFTLEPENIGVLGELCENFFPDGLTEEGVQYIRKGIQLDPQDGRFHILMGENYRTLGMEDRALAEFRLAMNDKRWQSNAQRLIWQIEKPQSQEEITEREFFNRGKEQ